MIKAIESILPFLGRNIFSYQLCSRSGKVFQIFALLVSLAVFHICKVESAGASAPASYVAVPGEVPTIAWGTGNKSPAAVILCIHGLGLHKGSYDDFGKAMSAKGIPVYALDIRGFGDWHLRGEDSLDFGRSFLDIRQLLGQIRTSFPHARIYLLGESMGGAIALQAAARYPELIDGLISSVPSGDRWSGLGEDLKIGLHVIAGGFGTRFDVGKHVVEHATMVDERGKVVNESLRKRWLSDPSGRNEFSPDELICFQKFMAANNEAAAGIKTLPVLVIQGAMDRLVRPSGSYFVWKHLSTPDTTFALSKNCEHLIFEYGQFSDDDIKYVLNWIATSSSALPDQTVGSEAPVVPANNRVPEQSEILAGAQELGKSKDNIKVAHAAETVSSQSQMPTLSYWIELARDGKHYSCNNKSVFRSGDEIRIHVISNMDGFAYILMKQGSSGAHALLFPEAQTGRSNKIAAGHDYALPSARWLKFDEKPGTEKLSLIFSRNALDPDSSKYLGVTNCIVSSDRSGAKDLCPTRMQISWDDPNPLIMPPLSDGSVALVSSLVNVSSREEAPKNSVMAIDIVLEHQK